MRAFLASTVNLGRDARQSLTEDVIGKETFTDAIH